MDEFVKKAFKDSLDEMEDREAVAFKEEIADKSDVLFEAIGMSLGLDKAENMARAIVMTGNLDTFQEFLEKLLATSFHRGFKRGRMSL